jgi:hypothetical protein
MGDNLRVVWAELSFFGKANLYHIRVIKVKNSAQVLADGLRWARTRTARQVLWVLLESIS